MFIELYKFIRLVMHLNPCSMDLGRDNISWQPNPIKLHFSLLSMNLFLWITLKNK